MKNSLRPIEGSLAVHRASCSALRRHFDVQAPVLNVRAPVLHSGPDKLVSPDVIAPELRSAGEELLVQPGTMAQAAGVACVPGVRIGSADEEGAAYAAEQGCDAIVMGTRGMGAVDGLVLGSVAPKVGRLARVPFTLVE